MDLKQVSINSIYKFENVEKVNDEFTKVKIRVQGVGKNRNMSYMSKESIEKNLQTLSYCPVVGHLIEKEDGTIYMGGHDEVILLTEQGIKFKSLTVPFGVVIKDSFNWEDVEEYGQTVTYLTTEAFLWTKRYDEILSAIYNSEVWFGQSMELSVSQYRPYADDSNYTELLDWNYSALCLLGKSDNKNSEEHTEPCFISSDVKPLDFSINSDFAVQMEELKKELSFYFEELTKNKNGGEKMTEEMIMKVLAKYNVFDIKTIGFEITDDMTEEIFESKVKEFVDSNSNPTISHSEQFISTYNQKRQALTNACDGNIERDSDGNIIKSTHYWVQDFDDNYVYVEQYIYSDNEDEEKNGRFSYTFDEEGKTATLTSEFEEMIVRWLTLDESKSIDTMRNEFTILQTEFETYKNEYSISNIEANELKEFKASIMNNKHKSDVSEILSEFSDLVEIEEFKILSEKALDYTNVEDLKKECYAIRGKNLKVNFAKNPNGTVPKKAPLNNFSFDGNDDGFGGILANVYKKQ